MIDKFSSSCVTTLLLRGVFGAALSQDMDKMWGESVVKLRAEDAKRGQLFADGNYAMFIHWGLYSQLANKVDGRTYYGIGEWKSVVRVHDWKPNGKAVWEVDILKPGDYHIHLTYSGEGRLVWGVDVEGGEHIQNQQNSSHNYQEFPIGWIQFPKPGRYEVRVSCLEGNTETASLKSIWFAPIP